MTTRPCEEEMDEPSPSPYVFLQGLQNAKYAHLNGILARRGAFSEAKGRWAVQACALNTKVSVLRSGGSQVELSVKPDNLKPATEDDAVKWVRCRTPRESCERWTEEEESARGT